MLFRVLKFKPAIVPASAPLEADARPTARRSPAGANQDTDYFWEGTAGRRLRIQKCNACGAAAPRRTVCPACHAMDRGSSWPVATARSSPSWCTTRRRPGGSCR